MYTKEDFNKVWKDSSREDILNQFYYDHMEMERFKNIINELEKLIEQYSQNDYYYKYNGKYLKSEIIKDLKELKGGK